MPELKQPPSLLKIVTDRLVNLLAKRCNECSIKRSLNKLRRVVAFIKEDIGPKIPWQMGANFFVSFLYRYLNGFKPRKGRRKSHKRAVLEVIMDRKVVGLSLSSALLKSMDMKNAHRIRGLRSLDLPRNSRRYKLEKFHLEDLERFIHRGRCTDADLLIIAENCPKLDYLFITKSKHVTDKGIVALNSCTELRTVNVWGFPKITNRGVQEFLEAHKKIELFVFNFRCFSDGGWSVYPSITEFDVCQRNITNSDLRCIAERLPNLVRLNITGRLIDPASLSTLGSLKKLTCLHFRTIGNVIIWDALKPLLRSIGAQITGLHASSSGPGSIASCMTEADLDFLLEFCSNIKYLSFNYNARAYGRMFVIPPFGRLRELLCSNSSLYPDDARLQFGVMGNLKKLYIINVKTTTEMLESMVLDNDKFPVLDYIGIYGVSSGCDANLIREIVKNDNIDLRLNVYPWINNI